MILLKIEPKRRNREENTEKREEKKREEIIEEKKTEEKKKKREQATSDASPFPERLPRALPASSLPLFSPPSLSSLSSLFLGLEKPKRTQAGQAIAAGQVGGVATKDPKTP